LTETYKIKNDGHLEQFRVAISYFSGAVRNPQISQSDQTKTMWDKK
jgi:hypothetical protein